MSKQKGVDSKSHSRNSRSSSFSSCGVESMDQSEVRKVFSRFDANGDGKISTTELTEILRALGSDAHPDEVR